jgi:hypothetical protein
MENSLRTTYEMSYFHVRQSNIRLWTAKPDTGLVHVYIVHNPSSGRHLALKPAMDLLILSRARAFSLASHQTAMVPSKQLLYRSQQVNQLPFPILVDSTSMLYQSYQRLMRKTLASLAVILAQVPIRPCRLSPSPFRVTKCKCIYDHMHISIACA